MSNLSPIEIVSLGSGQPEHITLRAYSSLLAADTIINPGKAAAEIVGRLPEGTALLSKSRQLDLPMRYDRSETLQAYRKVAEELSTLRSAGKRVALTTIGDTGTYSTAQYVCDELTQMGIPFNLSPGIPYYVSVAAQAGSYLMRQEEPLTVLSHQATAQDLATLLTQGHTVVVMKLSAVASEVKELLASHDDYSFVYAEHLGSPSLEWISSDYRAIADRPFPYFSLIIIRPHL